MNMIKDIGVLMMLATGAVNAPALLPDTAQQPETLSEYIQMANDGTLKPDPVVTMVANLCPVILEASEGQDNIYASQMNAACGLLQGAQTSETDINNLLAMVQ